MDGGKVQDMNCYFGCNLFCYDVNGIAVVDLAVADVVIVAHFIPPGPTNQVALPVFLWFWLLLFLIPLIQVQPPKYHRLGRLQ